MDPLLISALLSGASALGSGAAALTQKSGKWGQQPTQAPWQTANTQAGAAQGLNMLRNPLQGFQPIANQATNQWNNQVLPGLAERFSSLGNNQLSSPQFASNVGQAGTDLQGLLASLGAQYGQGQQELGTRLLGLGQTPQFENVYTAGGPSWLSGIFGGLSQAAGNVGNYQMNKATQNTQFNQQQQMQNNQFDQIKSIIDKLRGF
jgi:hypothetical protein